MSGNLDKFNTVLNGGTYTDLQLVSQPSAQGSWIPPFTGELWGIPSLDSSTSAPETVQYLWQIFFGKFVKVSQEQWEAEATLSPQLTITNGTYYTQVFKQSLQDWFQTLATGDNSLPYQNPDAPSPPIPEASVPGTPVEEDPIIFTLPPGKTTATFTFQDWLVMDEPVSWNALQSVYLSVVWTAYLTNLNVGARTQSAFLWVYIQLISLIRQVEISAISQGQRITALVTAQKSAITAMTATVNKFRTPTEASDSQDITFNQQYQMWIQVYQGNASVINSYVSQQNSRVQQTTQSTQDLDTLMTNLIQQMQTILSNLFRN